ncbi:RNA polymerase sigma factor [Alloiococcus sp. CFN-8]|uniref:RNA polymerase sigma factor n=1 Tax=Alloiococcus sp. CFN-8 TaxID=3416081 RepID=UPI003CF5B0AF
MEDKQIVDLYWARSESAISETADKYGRYCYYIAFNILYNDEDSKECVNDTYMKAWGAMPTHRPNKLSTFIGKITRNLSLHKYEKYTAEKRGAGQVPLALDELKECVPSWDRVEQAVDDMVLIEIFNSFLGDLSIETRKIFMRRYWYLSSIKEIAADFKVSESKVKMSLLRTRKKLKQILEKEGVVL